MTQKLSGLAGSMTTARFAMSVLARRRVRTTPCDVLLLFTYGTGPARHAALAEALRARGLAVACEVVTRRRIVTGRMLLRPEGALEPLEAVAAYLVARYRPRLLVTFLNATPLASPLMRCVEAAGGFHINIAHSVMAPQALDPVPVAHYQFVFGESSVRAFRTALPPLRTTKLVKTGSIYLDARRAPPPAAPVRRVLFASTWIPKGCEGRYLPAFKAVSDWIKNRPDVALDVKPHPLNDATLIRRYFRGLANVRVLPRNVSPEAAWQALAPVRLLLSPFSCFSLEASVAGRPSVPVGVDTDGADYLELDRFFTPVAETAQALDQAVEESLADYAAAVARCQAFAAHHLDRVSGGLEYTTDCLEALFQGRESFSTIPIAGTDNGSDGHRARP